MPVSNPNETERPSEHPDIIEHYRQKVLALAVDRDNEKAHRENARREAERLRGEVARLQSERDRETERAMHWQCDYSRAIVDRKAVEAELSRVRAEVTAAKADALEQAADEIQRKDSRWVEGEPLIDGPLSRWLRARAADTRAELGDS